MLVVVIFAAVLSYYICARLYRLSKWDHLPGFKAYQSVPIIGHGYKLGSRAQLEVFEPIATCNTCTVSAA